MPIRFNKGSLLFLLQELGDDLILISLKVCSMNMDKLPSSIRSFFPSQMQRLRNWPNALSWLSSDFWVRCIPSWHGILGLSSLDSMHSQWAVCNANVRFGEAPWAAEPVGGPWNLYILQTNLFATFRPAVLWTTKVHWRREEAKMKTVAVRCSS